MKKKTFLFFAILFQFFVLNIIASDNNITVRSYDRNIYHGDTVSAYRPHSFYGGNYTNFKWTFYAEATDGSWIEIESGSPEYYYTTSPLAKVESTYKISDKGILNVKIEQRATVKEVEHSGSLLFCLDLKPDEIKINTTPNKDSWLCVLNTTIESGGASSFFVYSEEEDFGTKNGRTYDAIKGSVSFTRDLYYGKEMTFEVFARNTYGETSKTSIIPAVYPNNPIEGFSISGKYANGGKVKPKDIFLASESFSLAITNNLTGEQMTFGDREWLFTIETITEEKDTIFIFDKVRSYQDDVYNFTIPETNTKGIQNWKTYSFDGDSSVYLSAKIVFNGLTDMNKGYDYIHDEIPIWLNVLPSVPSVEVMDDITCDVELDEWGCMTGSANLKYHSERAERLRIDHKYNEDSSGGAIFLVDGPSGIFNVYWGWDFGEIYVFRSYNSYGSVATGSLTPFKYKNETSLSETNSNDIPFTFYPNPVEGVLHISGNFNNILSISINDMEGKLMKTITDVSKETIDFSGLLSGIYILSVEYNNNSRTERFKIVKK